MLISRLLFVSQYGKGSKEGISHKDLITFAKVRQESVKESYMIAVIIYYTMHFLFKTYILPNFRILSMFSDSEHVFRFSNFLKDHVFLQDADIVILKSAMVTKAAMQTILDAMKGIKVRLLMCVTCCIPHL